MQSPPHYLIQQFDEIILIYRLIRLEESGREEIGRITQRGARHRGAVAN